MALPSPALTDDVAAWAPTRAAAALHAAGLQTFADVVVRRVRRRRWWTSVPGFGAAAAGRLEELLDANPGLLQRGHELVARTPAETQPWERLVIPADYDGSAGTFRAPKGTSTLGASNDYQAVNAWLLLHEAGATVRAYRKEAERLMLWSVLERGRPLSSLTTEDAVAYRSFLRRPTPAARWVGPAVGRASGQWRPFQRALSPRSAAYALVVINALFRWLVEQRYLIGNAFAGVKVKGGRPDTGLDPSHALNDHEWDLVRPIAADLELLGWTSMAAQRMRFVLDFAYATGLRPGELVAARLGNIQRDEHGDTWLHVVGKGGKKGRVALPTMAISALEWSLVERGLAVSPHRWNPRTPLVPSLDDGSEGVTTSRLWMLMKRFFKLASERLKDFSPGTADKLTRASPHWMRHSHASHALGHGAELVTVRDNLRHASISTTSVYLHGDDVKRARQMRDAFAGTSR
jgi:site-specific recombinase XerD